MQAPLWQTENMKPRTERRGLTIGVLGATVAASYLGGAVRRLFLPPEEREAHRERTHRKNAQRILDVSGRLKGGIMKAMQLLSYQSEVLPDEYLDVLAGLQDQAPPMTPAEARAAIAAELGKPPEKLFARFTPEAAAAASLGQVHRATLHDGREVAVKIQYPDITDQVASDLRLLKRSLTAQKVAGADLLRQSGLDHRHLHDDIAARLLEELDYRREAAHLKLFGEIYAARDDVVVPGVIDDLSSEHVLTMDWIDGYPLRDIMNEGADYALREQVLATLNWMSMNEVLGVGITHADPHPGNYLVTAEGRVALLDFGCVKAIDEARLALYRDEVRALLSADRELLARTLLGLGVTEEGRDPAPAIAFIEFMYLPLLHEGPFDPRGVDFPAELARRMNALVRTRHLAFPTETVFLIRKFLGQAALFRALRVHTLDFRRAYEDFMRHDVSRANRLRTRLMHRFPEVAQAARAQRPPGG
jgi:predicted unusual protein kinase regulating ubiquinone biosynthesis (AarF/ABC1/UbiB family)